MHIISHQQEAHETLPRLIIQPISAELVDVLRQDNTHMFVRHLQTIYNTYAQDIQQTKQWNDFVHTSDLQTKQDLYQELQKHYHDHIGADKETSLSDQGKEEGKRI
jgi:hypothetical protein